MIYSFNEYRAVAGRVANRAPAAPVMATQGLIKGTRVASQLGWRSVEHFQPGDRVLTLDNGLRTVNAVRHVRLRRAAMEDGLRIVSVPAGAIENMAALSFLPQQGVMIDDPAIDDLREGAAASVLPACALVGYRGVSLEPCEGDLDIVMLSFAEPELVYVQGGALAFCPPAVARLPDMIGTGRRRYVMLTPEEAEYVVDCLLFEEAAAMHGSTRRNARPCA